MFGMLVVFAEFEREMILAQDSATTGNSRRSWRRYEGLRILFVKKTQHMGIDDFGFPI
jgi:hypothetical protein